MIKKLEAEKIEKKLTAYAYNEASKKVLAGIESQLEEIARECPLLAEKLFGAEFETIEFKGSSSNFPKIFCIEVRNGIRYAVGITADTKLSSCSWVVNPFTTDNLDKYIFMSWDTDNSVLMVHIESIIDSINKDIDQKLIIQKQRLFQ